MSVAAAVASGFVVVSYFIEFIGNAASDTAAASLRVFSFFSYYDGGRIMSGDGGSIVVDGPFTETKEAIGGYFVIEAADYAEATELAKGCPVFANGGVLEVRQIEL